MFHVSDLIPVIPWFLPFLTLPRLTSRKPDLTHVPAVGGRFVSVIVPARNEASTIATVVRSILATEYQPFELLVVDDRSTDDTAAIVSKVADPRLRLIAGEELPEGWYGKPWACYQGYQAAAGEILLFTDADTRHAPALLGHAVGAMTREGAGLVTVSPRQLCISFWERAVMPQIWFLLALRYDPAAVNRARTERDVIANGQFILTTREAYEAAGTHLGVRQEVAEDLALAQAFVRHGRRLYFAYAEQLMETRMYQNLSQLIEGWSKNIYLGGRRSFPHQPVLRALVPLMLVVALGFWLVPPGVLLAGAILPGMRAFTLPALVATLMSALFWMLMARLMQIPVAYGAAYPVGALMALFIVGRSTWRGGGKVEWRGRTYRD
ncbi:MAG: glycosyl transferase family 2 [Geminicoccaceae bacterium]|nr:glycosyl transferase family 2 [Geminicoccaceae bacterium]